MVMWRCFIGLMPSLGCWKKPWLKTGLPYKIVGGLKFYQRKEIKDILAYMRVVANPSDDVSLTRIINVPRRGIGNATLNKLRTLAEENNRGILT